MNQPTGPGTGGDRCAHRSPRGAAAGVRSPGAMYTPGQKVIERVRIADDPRTPLTERWSEEVVEIVSVEHDLVVTETGLTYTPSGTSDLQLPRAYRSIRALAYAKLGEPRGGGIGGVETLRPVAVAANVGTQPAAVRRDEAEGGAGGSGRS